MGWSLENLFHMLLLSTVATKPCRAYVPRERERVALAFVLPVITTRSPEDSSSSDKTIYRPVKVLDVLNEAIR